MTNTDGTRHKKGGKEHNEASQSACGCGDIVNDFIEDVWSVMSPKMVDRLKCILREDMGMSKQDVDKFIDDQREVRRQRICLKKNRRNVRIGLKNQWIKEVAKIIGDQMAAVVVGILLSNRTARTKRVAEKVLERLCEITGEDTTVESAKTRVERTLVIVADRMATWIDEAITNIEETMQDKYMSAASLEALPTAVEQYYPITTPTSSGASLVASSISHSSAVKSKSTLSVVKTDSEERVVKRKISDDKPDEDDKSEEEENTDEKKGDEESKGEGSSTDSGGTEESVAEEEDDEETVEEEVEVEEDEVETEEEDTEETDDEEFISEENAETEEEMESEEEIEEEEGEEVEEEEDMEEEELEDKEIESLVEDKEEDIDYKDSSEEDIKEQAVSSFDISSDVISSKHEQRNLQGDVLDLLKEDIAKLPRDEDESDRQKAMKEVIDKRLEKVAKDKLEKSLDSLVKYDIDKAASIVANWVEKILASADRSAPLTPYTSQGPAFEIKREGSQFEVSKVSSTSVAKQVAEVRGLDPPLRKKKIPRTMSPMDLKSGQDWADWALGAANVGEEWGKWLDSTINEAEKQLSSDRFKNSQKENYNEWVEWRDKRSKEAQKWRVEKEKIKDEGALWNRKMKGDQKQAQLERETLSHIY